MAQFDFLAIKEQYDHFRDSFVDITVNEERISENKKLSVVISDIDIEMTSGFEASMATFVLYGAYDTLNHNFFFEEIKKYIVLGSAVSISLGYALTSREVFRGFIGKVRFIFGKDELPGVEITAMDVKGIMMANNSSRQLKSETYKDAIEEIFAQPYYNNMQTDSIIKEIVVDKTPDMESESGGAGGAGTGGGAAPGGEKKAATDKSIEMVAESDYEFVVKAAKKFNFEFFSIGGIVAFREPKKIKEPLFTITPGAIYNGMDSYSVEYDITGLVEKVEVRGVDVGKNRPITSTVKKLKNKISFGSKANHLIKDQSKVYIDPTIHSKEEADLRAAYLAEDIAYRFGTLEAHFRGIPELTPGYFIEFSGFGNGVDNKYYITGVRHLMEGQGGYTTIIKAKAASVDGSAEDNQGGDRSPI